MWSTKLFFGWDRIWYFIKWFNGRTAAYYTTFIPQKLSNERTNYYTCNWCGCHLASKIHLGYTLNICTYFLGSCLLASSQCEQFTRFSPFIYEVSILVHSERVVKRRIAKAKAKASKYKYIFTMRIHSQRIIIQLKELQNQQLRAVKKTDSFKHT